MCFLIKLGRYVSHIKRMDPIDFGRQRPKVKITIDMYGNKLVNMIETKPLCYFINLGRHVSLRERMDPINFGGQMSNVKVTKVLMDI